MKRIATYVGWLMLLVMLPGANAQVQVGDDLRMNLSGFLNGGYNGSFGDQIPSTHSVDFGGNAQLNGSYYNPNFLNFTVTPYYDQSRANSSFQSLTGSSGVEASTNLFAGSRFPGFASYHYTRDSTSTLGLVGSPNFTTVGNGQGFGVGWSALIPDWPTFTISYTQGSGTGTLFGTNEQSSSSLRTLNLRSSYRLAGWQLNANYSHLSVDATFPLFLGGQEGKDFSDSSGNNYGLNGYHSLPWHGSVAINYNHSAYSGDFGSDLGEHTGITNYTTDTETTNFSFHPTVKLGLFANQSYTNNLNGFFYQNLANSGGGVPLQPLNSKSDSSALSTGANYAFTKNLYGQAQITFFNQTYFGKSYDGSYLTGTVGYGKRILNTFTFSGSVNESSNKFASNSLGFLGNLNAFRHLGAWEASGNLSYAQNVQTLLVTYTTSYYNYGVNIHRGLGRGKQWTGAMNGSHSGFTDHPGSVNQSLGVSTSLAVRRIGLTGNYMHSSGQSILTSTGIQPVPPTPGLPPEGLIVYNGTSYGGGVTLTPISRLTLTESYSHAVSNTLGNNILSNNRNEIFYSQLQYRLRKISLLGGFTKFSQGISAAGTPPGNQYSYFIGVSRSINFF